MGHVYHHALTSVRLFGGNTDDYIEIHRWFDEPKKTYGCFRHRALRHHAFGIFECEKAFGVVITNSDGKAVPVRIIAEQHVREDCGNRIPSVEDWLKHIDMKPWMISTQPAYLKED